MTVSEAKLALSKADFKKYAMMFSMIASSIAGMTSNKRDDAAAALINNLVTDPDQFNALCELLGIE